MSFLSLDEYDKISEIKLRNNGIKVTDENVAFINEMMIKADMKYTEGLGVSRLQYRNLYAKYGIKHIKRNFVRKSKSKYKEISINTIKSKESNLNFDVEDERPGPMENLVVKEIREAILNNKLLTETEKDVYDAFFFKNESVLDIHKRLNFSRWYIYLIIKQAKIKLEYLKCYL